jgi:hypothetical protein
MDATKKQKRRPPEVLSLEDVLKRVPLLKRVLRDVVECYERRRKAKEFCEELTVISRKFRSSEIDETIHSLQREVAECDRTLQAYDKEVRDLGGILKDPARGLVYFYSVRDKRKVFLIWELREPDLLSWHELDETFSDRERVELPAGARASVDGPEMDYPEVDFPESE